MSDIEEWCNQFGYEIEETDGIEHEIKMKSKIGNLFPYCKVIFYDPWFNNTYCGIERQYGYDNFFSEDDVKAISYLLEEVKKEMETFQNRVIKN